MIFEPESGAIWYCKTKWQLYVPPVLTPKYYSFAQKVYLCVPRHYQQKR
jgi:hypothetical protein